MKTPFFILALAFALGAQPLPAQLNPGDPLSGLERLKNFETRRVSSSDENWQNGNSDARPIAPGGTLTIADLKGPGVITHFWNTVALASLNYSALLTLRIYWDGEERPSVECPLGDFFGIGMGVDKSFTSLPIRVTADGRARNCYWPMPFRKSARITISNESDQPRQAFYFYVDWQKHDSLPADTAYFHAMYRQGFPCVMGKNYLLATSKGAGITSAPFRASITPRPAGMARGTISSSLTVSASRACAARGRRIISAPPGDFSSRTAPFTARRSGKVTIPATAPPPTAGIFQIRSCSKNRFALRSSTRDRRIFLMAKWMASSSATI